MSTALTYDFPWGTRPICPETHEATIGGDGYGGRCAALADVETIQESWDQCPKHFCELCCCEKHCAKCHGEQEPSCECGLCGHCCHSVCAPVYDLIQGAWSSRCGNCR